MRVRVIACVIAGLFMGAGQPIGMATGAQAQQKAPNINVPPIIKRAIPKTQPSLEPEAVRQCGVANLAIQQVRINTARYDYSRNGIVMDGCFGQNENKSLTVYYRKYDDDTPRDRAPSWRREDQLNPDLVEFSGIGVFFPFADEEFYDAERRHLTVDVLIARASDGSAGGHLSGAKSVVVTGHQAPTPANAASDNDGDGVTIGEGDCNDTNPRISPNENERWDSQNIDEDCNITTFGDKDTDGDGYIDGAHCQVTFTQGRNNACGTDCNDNNSSMHPHQVDPLNGRDDDCDGRIDDDQTVADVKRLLGLQ